MVVLAGRQPGPDGRAESSLRQLCGDPIPYAIDRYVNETSRLYAVLNKRLRDREFVAGDAYTIADIACYPWTVPHQRQRQNLDDFPRSSAGSKSSLRGRRRCAPMRSAEVPRAGDDDRRGEEDPVRAERGHVR
jgi:glutathione S-transferase